MVGNLYDYWIRFTSGDHRQILIEGGDAIEERFMRRDVHDA